MKRKNTPVKINSNGKTETWAFGSTKAKNAKIDENPPAPELFWTKTYVHRFWYTFQNSVSTSVDFPVEEASPRVPAMALKLSLNKEACNNLLKLDYDYHANKSGEACPMYDLKVSAKYAAKYDDLDGFGSIYESETVDDFHVLGAADSELMPLQLPIRKDVWVTVVLTLNLYCNRDVGARANGAVNFSGDLWNERHQPSLTIDLLESGLNSDVKVISREGQEFNAHKHILRTRNEVFDAMFGIFRYPEEEEETETGVVRLDDMSAKAVKFLLHFIYSTQTLKISTKENDADGTDATIAEVLHLVDKFGLTELKNYLDENLGKFCNKENCSYLFKLCKLHSLEKGKRAVYEFMKENNSEFVNEAVLELALKE